MKASPSKIMAFGDYDPIFNKYWTYGCPRKFFHNYIQRLETKPSIYLTAGTIVHETIEEFYKSVPPVTDDNYEIELPKYIGKIFRKVWKRHMTGEDFPEDVVEKKHTELEIIVGSFARRFITKFQVNVLRGKITSFRQGWYKLRPQLNEHKCSDPIMNITGKLDAVYKDFNGRTTIIDYKTSTHYKDTVSTENVIQLSLYAHMLSVQDNIKADYMGIHFLVYDEVHLIRVDPEHLVYAKNLIRQFHKNTQSEKEEDYPKRAVPNVLCKGAWGECDFYPLCFLKKKGE